MLVLSRKTNEAIRIGDEIRILVIRSREGSVRIGIEAPKSMNIVREELLPPEIVAHMPDLQETL